MRAPRVTASRRVFESGGRLGTGGLASRLVSIDDPEQIGTVLRDLARRARRNADMSGNDHD